MRSSNRKMAIKRLTQNPKGYHSHVGYFGSRFCSGNCQAGNDRSAGVTRGRAPAGLPPWYNRTNFLCGVISCFKSF